MLWIRRYTLPLLATGFLALVALATFLILDLTGAGPDSASDLPVVGIGQSGVGSSSQETADGLATTSPGTLPGLQGPTAEQRGGSEAQEPSQTGGGSGQPFGSGPQNGPGQQGGALDQGGTLDQGGDGRASSTNTSTSADVSNTTGPSIGSSPGMSIGSPSDTTAKDVVGPGTTGSTLRQTVNGRVRVEGPLSGQGKGGGSTPATTGGGR